MAFGCCMDIGFVRNGEKYKGKQYLRERCNLLQEPHNCSHWADADRDCAPQSFNLIRTLIRQATLITIFQYFLCKLPVALCAAHIASYISTADKQITSRLTITGHNRCIAEENVL